MSVNILPLTTVINVSVSAPGASLQPFQINNLCFISGETPINPPPASGFYLYQDTASVANDWGSASETFAAAVSVFSQTPNVLSGDGYLIVYKQVSNTDTFLTSIQQLQALAYAGGFMPVGFQPSQSDYLAAGGDAQANNYIVFAPTSVSTDVTNTATQSPPGLGALAVSESLSNLRVIFYGGAIPNYSVTSSPGPAAARVMVAAYASRAMSTDFSGTATAMTMELKSLATIPADPTVTLSLYGSAQANGVDVYALTAASYLPKVRTSGTNQFYDDVYNLLWFVGALQVAAFNSLATTSTKIPQTEGGMTTFKRPLRNVCSQAVTNGFVAPGAWTSPDTFGDPVTFVNNIASYGYYVYSIPVAQQNPAERVARQAPLVQIAIKYAGAIQTASILVNINY